MASTKLYHRVAFRLTVYALLAIIGGVNIWGEQLLRVPTTHSQTVSPNSIVEKAERSYPTPKFNSANIPNNSRVDVSLVERLPVSVSARHTIPHEFGIENVFQAYGALIRIFL